MRIIDNDALYQRNARLGFYANVLGALMILAAAYTLFAQQQPSLGIYFLLLLGGIIALQIGLYFGRWARRPDEALNQALKGLDDSYTIYHHQCPVPHLLVGPAGLWILMPKHTRGTITYNKDKQTWRSEGGNMFSRIYRRLTQEGVGRPHIEAMFEASALDRFLQEHWESEEKLHVQAAVVFVDPRAEVKVGDAPIPAATTKNLRKIILSGEEKGQMEKATIKKLGAILSS